MKFVVPEPPWKHERFLTHERRDRHRETGRKGVERGYVRRSATKWGGTGGASGCAHQRMVKRVTGADHARLWRSRAMAAARRNAKGRCPR